MSEPLTCDLAILGGGLAGGLIARAFRQRRPELRILLIEQGDKPGGNHIWSFFDGDVAPEHRYLTEGLTAHRWAAGHAVRFPGFERRLDPAYNSITSARFAERLSAELGERLLSGVTVVEAGPDHVRLGDGRHIVAGAVIDARGPDDLAALRCGWQKFVGQTLRLAVPHGLDQPVIMDATVEQADGYRFVYLLPWDDRRIFVEDTYYSDSPALDAPLLERRIAAYAKAQGWQVEAVEHRESGVLPVVHGGDFDRYWPADDPLARAGVRAGLFQPMTGYSLPDAVRFAHWLADQPLKELAARSRAYAAAHWRRGAYYRLLGKMLFGAAAPEQRWRIFARFYRLSPGLIRRFYAGRSSVSDRIRILCGRPPVPIRDAMRALLNPPA